MVKFINMIAAAVLLSGAEAQRGGRGGRGGQRGGQRGGMQQQPQRGAQFGSTFTSMASEMQQQPQRGAQFGSTFTSTASQTTMALQRGGGGGRGIGSGSRRGRGGGHGLSVETLETCSDVIEFDCALDADLDLFMDDLREREALKEAGDYAALSALEGTDELKATMGDIRACLSTVKETLPEEDACSVALASLAEERGGRGRGRGHGFPLDKIAACADEVSSDACGLDFNVYDFLDELEQLEAERELRTCRCGHGCVMTDGVTTGMCQADGQTCSADLAEPTCTSEEQELVKHKLEQVRTCLSSIKDTLNPESECAIALEGRHSEEPEPTDTIGDKR